MTYPILTYEFDIKSSNKKTDMKIERLEDATSDHEKIFKHTQSNGRQVWTDKAHLLTKAENTQEWLKMSAST